MLEDDRATTEGSLVEGHVASCIVCQRALEELTRDSYFSIAQTADKTEPDVSGFLQRVIENPPALVHHSIGTIAETILGMSLEGPTSQPVIPGYEVLNELGHGGMGVVFRAREVRLSRIVALKMLLPGGSASPELLARFKVEAETVARLQHPNVVRIHAVGDHEGRPFFEMEYVAGAAWPRGSTAHPGNLARRRSWSRRSPEASRPCISSG